MGRHKKRPLEEKEEKLEAEKPSIAGEAKRGLMAVLAFSLALLLTLSFFGKSGIVGEKLNNYCGLLIGWGKLFLPLFLFLAGFILILKRKTPFYLWKIFGLFVILLSLTGFLHWFLETEKMWQNAKAGLGGGFLGYGLAFLATKYLGKAGGLVLILTIFFCGLILAFNFSLSGFFAKLRNFLGLEKEESQEEEKESEPVLATEIPENKMINSFPEEKLPLEKEESHENIGKIEFVEGPDVLLSNQISQKSSTASLEFRKKKLRSLSSVRAPRIEKGKWTLPPLELLARSQGVPKGGDLEKNAEIIEKTLRHFGIEVERGEIKTGPSVTQYSFRPAVGIKVSRILALQNDLALALAAQSIRIEAPIPGRSVIGIEVPNKISTLVRLRDVLESSGFSGRESNLTLALGEDVSENYVFGNLEKMPHLMIAGATGTGKSVCVNSIITTLLYQNSPEDLKFIMIDPKRVELSVYNEIPHLLCRVIVENSKVINSLKWAVREMEDRYKLLQGLSSVSLSSFNEKVKKGKKLKKVDPETGEVREESLNKLPYIVIIIDEVADLMTSHGREVEGAIVRLAQMARAVGIHLVVSTQRPSVEIITGLIKANITNRIAFQVASQIDSRTIIDVAGAEKLLGNGDMLYLSASSPKPKRIQGVFVSEEETRRVVDFIKAQKAKDKESYSEDVTKGINFGDDSVKRQLPKGDISEFKDSSEEKDPLLEEAKEEIRSLGKASASFLQRRLKIGYARAARILDILEEEGAVGPADGAKAREIFLEVKGQTTRSESAEAEQAKRDKWQF